MARFSERSFCRRERKLKVGLTGIVLNGWYDVAYDDTLLVSEGDELQMRAIGGGRLAEARPQKRLIPAGAQSETVAPPTEASSHNLASCSGSSQSQASKPSHNLTFRLQLSSHQGINSSLRASFFSNALCICWEEKKQCWKAARAWFLHIGGVWESGEAEPKILTLSQSFNVGCKAKCRLRIEIFMFEGIFFPDLVWFAPPQWRAESVS